MDDYLAKPVLPRALDEILARWQSHVDGGQRTVDAALTTMHVDSPAPVVFDRASMLERLMNDEQLAGEVIEKFLEDIPCQIETLRRYLDVSDASGAERQAHLLKGAAANVGGEALRALAFEMEKAGKTGDLGSVAGRMDDLEIQFRQLQEAMTQEVRG
jgi:HPt (histidine-containing phosphotransfer) domain-containing protein